MLPQNKPDRIRILFDDHRLVANAGLLLPATLARHLGLRELVDHHLDLVWCIRSSSVNEWAIYTEPLPLSEQESSCLSFRKAFD